MAHAADTPSTDPGRAARDDPERSDWGAEAPPIENLLYPGESVRETLDFTDGRLVATSHRVLALNPIGEAGVRSCERPNVEDVRPDTVADHQFAAPTLKALTAGLVLTPVGLLVSLDGLLSPLGADPVPGLEPIIALFSLLQRGLALLDDLLLVGGLLSLTVGLGGLVWYLNSRTPTVRVQVAGSEDLVVGGSVGDQRDLFAFRDLVRAPPDEEYEGPMMR